jgi:hypothetical protein
MQSNILKSLKEKIPNSFRVGGSTFYVNIVENSEKDLNGALGDCTNLLHQIRIAKCCRITEDLVEIPEDEFIKTYLHELGHCFGYYYKQDVSEEFANAFANFFYEYLTTKK